MREYNKASWGPGPWDNEPDKEQWTDEVTGLPCLIVRGPVGALCGYVGVAQGHPDFEKNYDDVDVSVHGGLTYADKCMGHICHVPEPGQPDHVWWLGFDCAHLGDFVPESARYQREQREKDPEYRALCTKIYSKDTYKDIEYVRAETTRLAQQLANRASAEPVA